MSLLYHLCHRYRHPGLRRWHHLLGKILRKNSVSTIHKYLMLLTNYNYQPRSFHFPRRSFGNKAWLSCEDITPARLVQQSIRGCTMMKARIYCFLCMKAVKKSILITSIGVQKRLLHLYRVFQLKRCQSSLRECSYVGACNCLPYTCRKVVPVHLAVIAGHDPVILYVDNLLCSCDDICKLIYGRTINTDIIVNYDEK